MRSRFWILRRRLFILPSSRCRKPGSSCGGESRSAFAIRNLRRRAIKAGIYAEFGKVICIVVAIPDRFGAIQYEVFDDPDEATLLRSFGLFLHTAFEADESGCARTTGKFDFPFIARRMLVNGLPLPDALDTAGRKPWEVQHLDTMELWKFGDYKAIYFAYPAGSIV